MISASPWLKIQTQQRDGQLALRFVADDTAPEGKFLALSELKYRSQGKLKTTSLTFTGSIESELVSDPPLLHFGVMRFGASGTSRECRINAFPSPSPLRIVLTSPDFSVKILEQNGQTLKFSAAPLRNRPGEHHGEVQVWQGSRRLGSVPLLVFVTSRP